MTRKMVLNRLANQRAFGDFAPRHFVRDALIEFFGNLERQGFHGVSKGKQCKSNTFMSIKYYHELQCLPLVGSTVHALFDLDIHRPHRRNPARPLRRAERIGALRRRAAEILRACQFPWQTPTHESSRS